MLTTSPPIQCDIQKKLHRSLANDFDLFEWVQETDSKGLSYWEVGAVVHFGLNHQLWRALGYAVDETKPEWSELVPETDQKALLEQLKSLSHPEVQKLELSLCFCTKQRRPLRFHCVAKKISNSESDSVSILCNHVELQVVSSKQLETPNISSIDQLRSVAMDAAPNSVIVVDPNGKIVLANKQAEHMFQYTQEELLNQPVDILLPDPVRDKHPQLLASYFRNPSSRPMGAGRDLVGRKKDGTTVPIEIGLNPIDGADGTFVFASIVDISERKLLEQKFRIALEAAPTAMIMINQLGQISLVNHQTEKLFGYDRKELLGQDIDILVPESVRKVHPKHLSGFFKNPETRSMGSGRELTGRHKNGSEIPIEIGLNPITESDEVQVIASVTDITIRTEHAKAILKHTKELELSIKELDNYAYVASHDLKAPLQGIRQLANWIEQDLEGQLQDETKTYIDLMQNRISRLEKLLEDLLAYSRLGWKHGDYGEVNVATITQEIFTLLNPPAGFQLKCDDSLPIFETLKTPFELIVRNLLNNAIKHRDQDSGIIKFSAKLKQSFYEFTLFDNGPGIPPEHHERVFGIFQTLKPRDEVEGSGIGLAMVRKLIDRYNCKINIESDGKRGTSFIFTWPTEARLRAIIDE